MQICPNCGEENPDRFRLCGICGTKLAPEIKAEEVRKTVSVIFTDLKGSTSLGERLDPESLREVLSRYFNAMRTVLERHGASFCVHDMPGLATPRWAVGPVAYVRFHGGQGKYWGRYPEEALLDWGDWMAEQASQGREVWAYFNNDTEAAAMHDALTLKAMVRQLTG